MEIVQGVEEKAMETDIQWYNTLIEMFYLNGASGTAHLSNVALHLIGRSLSGCRESEGGSR